MAYVKPSVEVQQELRLAPAELIEPLRPIVVGPCAQLHRFSEATEKALIALGTYDPLANQSYPWPGREAGSLVDLASTKLFIEDALLLYFEDMIGVTSNGRGTVTPVEEYRNQVKSSTINFKTNGSNARASLLKDRDVRVGDVAYIRGVTDEEDACNEHVLWTEVVGFVADPVAATVGDPVPAAANAAGQEGGASITKTAGPSNCVSAALAGGSTYDGMTSGYLSETYVVTVVKSGVSGCAAARLRVVSASGTDNVEELDPGALGEGINVPIGTRGVLINFTVASGGCVTTATNAGIAANELVIGQTWTIVASADFEATCAEAGGSFTGDFDDTYIVEVTKGGIWSTSPEITVTTARGLDSSGPLAITDDNTAFPIGTHGVTIAFIDCDGEGLGEGDNTLVGLRKGDKFYITVTGGAAGPIRTLILRDDLPTALADASDLDIRLFIKKTIEVTQPRLSAPPLTNYTTEATQINVKAGITAYDASWTSSGVPQPMTVHSATTDAGDVFGTQYAEYREWLSSPSLALLFIGDVADLDQIPGQLAEENTLKWAAFRALQNANGTRVGYIGVADPSSLDSWQNATEKLSGREDAYNLVPLTHNREVLNLFHAFVTAESAPEAANETAIVVNLQATETKMLVGQSSADAQLLQPTSTNGEVVLATLSENPNASGTQYTVLSVTSGNGGFLTYGVRAGDIVRYLYTIDAFGNASYREFVVDRVLSQSSLVLLRGYTDQIDIGQKVEIWRNLTKSEIVTDLVGQAQSFADRRVVATWPDIVGTAGNAQDGIFLAAAIAGLMGGVVPHQGLTNVEIVGFDDLASRTTKFFSASQLDDLAAGGVWICTESAAGTPHTRHALTTDMTDLKTQEEMIRRNLDSISRLLRNALRPYIGRTNVTPVLLGTLRYQITQQIKYLKRANYTNELGGQLLDAVFAKDADGTEIIRQHPLAADHVEIALDLTLPMVTNKIRLYLAV